MLLVMGVFRMTYDDLIRHLRFMVLDRYNCNEEAKDKLMKTAAYAIEELQIDALRYRWLRDAKNKERKGWDWHVGRSQADDRAWRSERLENDDLDAAIDEAMRESNR